MIGDIHLTMTPEFTRLLCKALSMAHVPESDVLLKSALAIIQAELTLQLRDEKTLNVIDKPPVPCTESPAAVIPLARERIMKIEELCKICESEVRDRGFTAIPILPAIIAALIPILTDWLSNCFNRASEDEVQRHLAEQTSTAQAATRKAIRVAERRELGRRRQRLSDDDRACLFDGVSEVCQRSPAMVIAAAKEFNELTPDDEDGDYDLI